MAVQVLRVNTARDQNDGEANGLSLRDAVIISNLEPSNDYIIELEAGRVYPLTINNVGTSDENDAFTGVRIEILVTGEYSCE